MSLSNAIRIMIAGASIFMLSPAFLTALPGASAASNSNRPVRADAVSTRKKTGKPARRVRSSPELNVAASDVPGLAKAPLHGYGTFEGVVLVPPAQTGKGIVLVEPAAAPAATEAEPTSESSDNIQIPKDLSEQQEDPFESFNRGMFAFNEVLDHLILEPSARIYHVIVPQPLREGVANAVRNLGSPVILANDILQGNRKRASDTVMLMPRDTWACPITRRISGRHWRCGAWGRDLTWWFRSSVPRIPATSRVRWSTPRSIL
jgi:hypothetical protein